MSYDAKKIWFFNPTTTTQQIQSTINTFYESWLKEHTRNDDLKLYHYTTIEGLKGILKKRSIWLTHISTLNDPTELKYGKKLILEIISDEMNKQSEDIINSFFKQLILHINTFDDLFYEVYVACFCESDNLLSQWRAYANRGGGYNLGFKFTSDTKFYHYDDFENESYVILRKILYNPSVQKEYVKNYISLITNSAKELIKNVKDNKERSYRINVQRAAAEYSNILCDLMLSFKNPVFEEEKEWRCILARHYKHKINQLQFRENEKEITPYIETYFIEKNENKYIFPLCSIKFGPILDVEKTKAFLKLFLEKEAKTENKNIIDSDTVVISGAGYPLRD